MDSGYYDLLASEARLASFVAGMKDPSFILENRWRKYSRFGFQKFSLAAYSAAVVATKAAVGADDAVAGDAWIVIRTHDGANGTSGFRVASFGSYLCIRHRLPFRDLAYDIADSFGK